MGTQWISHSIRYNPGAISFCAQRFAQISSQDGLPDCAVAGIAPRPRVKPTMETALAVTTMRRKEARVRVRGIVPAE